MRAARWRQGRVRGEGRARTRCCAAALGRIRAAVCLSACMHASLLLGWLRRSDSGDWGGDNTEQMELRAGELGLSPRSCNVYHYSGIHSIPCCSPHVFSFLPMNLWNLDY
jgi:hypothetical protein